MQSMRSMGWRTRVSAIGLQTFITLLALVLSGLTLPAQSSSRIEMRELNSKSLEHTLAGTNPIRKLAIYLPAGYDGSAKRYPVVYYLPMPGPFEPSFYQNDVRQLLDHAMQSGTIAPVLLVSVDMATPIGCSWYTNSPVTGNWEDFMIREVVPYIDASFRTMASRNSRGILGDFMGGYGAIRFGMTHPEVFGSVYAMHPVGTGSGIYTMYSRPDWESLAKAKSVEEIREKPYAMIFLSIFQASVPNVNKPPLYVDLQAHQEGGDLVIDSNVTERIRDNFLLETMVGKYADNLKSLRGFRFDWARNDGNHDHVYSNQALTHKLNEFGIPHDAEEYNGVWNKGKWDANERVETEVLPFFQRALAF
jgi:enterochelin esterase-like enzyme